jgi:hypothetical protein
MIDKNLQDFLPHTLYEHLAKLREHLNQAWPTFSSVGGHDQWRLYLIDHDQGTIVRFYRPEKPITFDPVGAVKYGAAWHLSAPINGLSKFNDVQMQEYLSVNELNWVIII